MNIPSEQDYEVFRKQLEAANKLREIPVEEWELQYRERFSDDAESMIAIVRLTALTSFLEKHLPIRWDIANSVGDSKEARNYVIATMRDKLGINYQLHLFRWPSGKYGMRCHWREDIELIAMDPRTLGESKGEQKEGEAEREWVSHKVNEDTYQEGEFAADADEEGFMRLAKKLVEVETM